MENFYTLLSNTGINAIIAARASNSEVKLTKIAVGDGDIIPSQDMTALKSEKHRFNINSIIQDIDNPNYLIVEGVIPSNIGGFYVSEVAIYTDQNTLFAIGRLPKTYKPLLEEGSAKDLTIKIFLEITNADSVTLKVDDSVVLATRKFVLSELKKYALINGDETKKFKVADAVELNEAVNKKQLNEAIDSLNQEITITGTATFDKLTQKITMTGIGNITLAIGDVIEVTGTNNNNQLFTVDGIVDNNNIIVNYGHRGSIVSIPSKKLINETSSATITLYNRAKNAQLGEGQGWVFYESTANRNNLIAYPSLPTRTMAVACYIADNSKSFQISEDGTLWKSLFLSPIFTGVQMYSQNIIPSGVFYRANGLQDISSFTPWVELR